MSIETHDLGPTGLRLRTVYVTDTSTVLNIRGAYITFRRNKKLCGKLPLLATRQLVLMRGVGVTGNVVEACLSDDIPITFLDRDGTLKGHLVGNHRNDPAPRLAQYKAWSNPESKREICRKLVDAKLVNTIRVLRRHARNHPDRRAQLDPVITRIAQRRRDLAQADDQDRIRGYEGITARDYFGVFGLLLHKHFTFNGRNRQPPQDPVNALLSLGYTLMVQECAGVSEAFGLDAYVGFMHENKPGRVSLALDLIEPLRVAIVDRMVIAAVNRGEFTPQDFKSTPGSDGAILLNQEGRAKFFALYDRYMTNCQTDGELAEEYWAPRSVMEGQCENFKRALVRETLPAWKPYTFEG